MFLRVCALSLRDGRCQGLLAAQPTGVSLDVVCIPSTQRSEATAAPDCNTCSSSSAASRRWLRVLAPQRVNPALAVAVGMMFHTQQQYSSNTVDITLSGNIMQFLLIILKLNFLYISGEISRRSSTVFGFLMPCWYSYSYHNNRYNFGQGGYDLLEKLVTNSKTK